MVSKNRENYRRDQKAKGKDDNEIKKFLNEPVETSTLIKSTIEEEQVLNLKGPFCTEFMLSHENITGEPSFFHIQTKIK